MNRLNMLEGAAIGASVAYLLDPDHGRARRRRLADRLGAASGSAMDSLISKVEKRAIAKRGRIPRALAIPRTRRRARSLILHRARRRTNEWDMPMATVNIDIDQGIVTLRGAFPPSEMSEVRATPHRGFTRAPIHLVGDEAETP
ncbi:MAG: hypothetical protein ACRDX9_08555 [Acidimicrobiia bacterium]